MASAAGTETEKKSDKAAGLHFPLATDYSTYNQVGAQQGYGSYAAQPTQTYGQATHSYGQQAYGTYGQPSDSTYTQPQSSAAAYGQAAYGTTYGQPPAEGTNTAGYTAAPAAHQGYTQPVQGYGTAGYDGTTTAATTTTTQASYGTQPAYGSQPAYAGYGQQQLASTAPTRAQEVSKPQENTQAQSNPAGYSQANLGYSQNNYGYPQVPGSYPVQSVSAQASYPPSSYSAAPTQPSSYEQSTYTQQQSGYGQQANYNQQSSYGQQGSYGQQPSNYPPPTSSSYSQPPPSQYGQQRGGGGGGSSSGNYGQQVDYNQQNQYSSYRQNHPNSMSGGSFSGPEPGGFPGLGESRGTGGGESRSRGRGGFDRGGMNRGGGRGGLGRGGMGIAGDRGGFIKPGAPVDDGPDPEPAPKEMDDSENNTVYVQGLCENVTLEEVADFFKHCGVIKINKRTGLPAINIYTDKDTGKPKGDATVSYEDAPIAKTAAEWFDGKEFQGKKLKVSMARRKPLMGLMRGGMMPRDMRGPPPGRGGMMGRGAGGGRGGDRGGFPPRGGPHGGGRGGHMGGNMQQRAGDWQCLNPGCNNQNFAWRMECNQCKAPKPEGFMPPPFPPPGGDRGRGGPGMRGGRGMDRGGPGGFRGGRGGDLGGGFRGGRGMDRGGFGGGRRGGPPMELMGGRGGRRGGGPPGKMEMKGDHRQDRRDRPY
ncbi:RNA-binding protein EWS-like isoform X1 [Polyodon spathula]|uniref:RNA-binding protein EWS-like isoform X1 n=1 Tax=Polyodon spathula TaxID=7913 RepID=UPI001B7F2DE6|nr:RNA-binding protein EWS-like isoform X1 [Polyodon spathula]